MAEKLKSLELDPSDFKKRVAELLEIGLDSDDIYAYHGTTIEAIKYLTEQGRLPADGSDGSEVFYAQIDNNNPRNEQLEHAKFYADWNSWKFYILERLPFKPKDAKSLADSYSDGPKSEEFFKEAAQHNVGRRVINKLWYEARKKRRGVVITLSKNIFKDFKEKAEIGDDQRSIITSNGLPIDYITGIEPLGQYEWDELEKLQKE